MIKNRKTTITAILTAVLMVFSLVPVSVSAAGDPDAVYEFDPSKTALSQLEDLFTTIDLMDATAAGLAEEMEKGNVTSEQLVRMYVDRISAYDKKKKLNSIISINPNAIEEARALDEERASGTVRGPLHGIPVVVKDNYDLKGTATTAGSLALADFVSETDSFVVQKLKAAGAVVIAKTNLSEFAGSSVDSHSLIGGNTHNPYDLTRSPAGSSGGTAAAVAANFATIGFGTDTGGSIRNPSSWCNLYGIRPSKGLTSVSGIVPLSTYRDTTGPMARTAEDMALALETIAGTDPEDDYTLEADADGLVADGYTGDLSKDGLKGKRIGYLASSFSYMRVTGKNSDGTDKYTRQEADPKLTQMIKRTRADLRKAGAAFVDMSGVFSDEEIEEIYRNYYYPGLKSTLEYDTNRYLNGHGSDAPYKTLKELFNTGKYGIDFENMYIDPDSCADSFEETQNPYTLDINGYDRFPTWSMTQADRAALAEAMDQNDVDAIMFLKDMNVAIHDEAEDINYDQLDQAVNAVGSRYATVFGMFQGCPDMVLPMGFSETDETCPAPMPVGMHFVGRFGDEKTLMQIAYAYEQQAGPDIRQMPECAPALKDETLNAYLEALMDEVYSIDYSAFGSKPEGRARLMEKAFDRAAAVDTSDPYAVYSAAYDLARAYDRTIAALKASGISLTKAKVAMARTQYAYTGDPIKPDVTVTVGGVTLVQGRDYRVDCRNNLNVGTATALISAASDQFAGSRTASFNIVKSRTDFRAQASKKKIKVSALKKKKRTVKIDVNGLTRGSSNTGFTIKKVTNGQKSKVKVDGKTGKVTLKKNTKKCKIYINVTSKANQNREGETRVVKIVVR